MRRDEAKAAAVGAMRAKLRSFLDPNAPPVEDPSTRPWQYATAEAEINDDLEQREVDPLGLGLAMKGRLERGEAGQSAKAAGGGRSHTMSASHTQMPAGAASASAARKPTLRAPIFLNTS